jgi:hypothetical protein
MVRLPLGRRPLHLDGQVDWQVVPLDPLSPGSNFGCVLEVSQLLFYAWQTAGWWLPQLLRGPRWWYYIFVKYHLVSPPTTSLGKKLNMIRITGSMVALGSSCLLKIYNLPHL